MNGNRLERKTGDFVQQHAESVGCILLVMSFAVVVILAYLGIQWASDAIRAANEYWQHLNSPIR